MGEYLAPPGDLDYDCMVEEEEDFESMRASVPEYTRRVDGIWKCSCRVYCRWRPDALGFLGWERCGHDVA